MAAALTIGAIGICLLVLLWKRFFSVSTIAVPHLAFEGDNSPARFTAEGASLLEQGYRKFTKNGLPFSIYNASDPPRPIAVLPMKYLEEVKHAPQSKLSFPLALDKTAMLTTICGPEMTEEVQHVTRMDLNKVLHQLITPMQEMVVKSFEIEMPPCKEWTSISLYDFIAQAFSRTGTRVLVGPDLCEGRWPSLARSYAFSIFNSPEVVRRRYSPRLRWLAKYFDPTVKAVLKYRREGAELLRPVIQARLAELNSNTAFTDTEKGNRVSSSHHQDAIQWLIEDFRAKGREITPDRLVQSLFMIMTASVDSTSSTALWVLFDIIEHPEALAEIREEITRVTGGDNEFVWTRQSLRDLRVMDSVMRESQRLHSVTQITGSRVAAKDYTFKDGLHIPKGCQVTFARIPYGLDSDVNPNPDKFDYRRHLDKRVGDDATKFHFASVSDDTLAWGTGIHACPGRFMAQEAMKLVFVRLLDRYDIKYDKPPGSDRLIGLSSVPDVTATVFVRERRVMN